jgi:non-ribosomal peptide synthetase component F
VERAGALELRFLYNTDLFDGALIEQLGRHLQRLIERVAHHAQLPLASLDVLAEDEHARLLAWGTGPRPSDAGDGFVLDRIAAQVARTPDAIAVEHAHAQLTYGELAARSERVAGWLARRGVTRGDRVAICVERSADMIAALLGVLRLGAAYVPIDPEYPAARRELTVGDTDARVVLDDAALRDALAATDVAPRAEVAPHDVA